MTCIASQDPSTWQGTFVLDKDGVPSWFLCTLLRQGLPSLAFQKPGCEVQDRAGIRADVKHVPLIWNKTYFCSDSHLQSPAENWLENHSEFCPWKLSAPVWNPSQSSDKMGKPQPDILGISKVKTSVKKSHLCLKDGHFKLAFKHVQQGKNLNCCAALELTNKKTHANLCKQFETKSKRTSLPFPNCAHKNGKHPTTWIYPSLH